MDAKLALPAVNFFIADVGGGLGPFLSTWLKEIHGWAPDRIGTVIAVGSLAGAVLAGPTGAIVDRVGRPRLLLGAACAIILSGTLLLLSAEAFLLVLAAQVVVAAGGALGAPASSGLTLAVVGKDGFPRQQGRNEAATHSGNVVAALAIAGLALLVGPIAAVYVLAVMACATVAVLALMDPGSVDFDRMRGRKRREKGAKRGATRNLAKNPRLWKLLLVVFLFQLGNSAMLPLLGQRVVAQGNGTGTSWVSVCVIAAQITMVPMALLVGRYADHFGRRLLLIFACCVVIARCTVAVFATENWYLVPIELLDGVAAATFSVSAPVAVADLTYGSGRTQTAMGGMGMMQAGGASLASLVAGFSTEHLGYWPTFAAMALFPALAILVLLTFHLRDEAKQSADNTATAEPAPSPA